MLPPILDGLADESEGVRQAALAAGRTLVDLYALSALELLLPAVERGCAHENWRIRQSSVELLGDLLFKVPVMPCRLSQSVEQRPGTSNGPGLWWWVNSQFCRFEGSGTHQYTAIEGTRTSRMRTMCIRT